MADTTKEATDAAKQPCHNLCHIRYASSAHTLFPLTKAHRQHSMRTLPHIAPPIATCEIGKCNSMPNLLGTAPVKKLPSSDGTFPNNNKCLLGTMHQYRTLVCRYTYIYNIGTLGTYKVRVLKFGPSTASIPRAQQTTKSNGVRTNAFRTSDKNKSSGADLPPPRL